MRLGVVCAILTGTLLVPSVTSAQYAEVPRFAFSSRGVYVAGGLPGQPRVWGLDAQTGRALFSRAIPATALAASSTRIYIGGGSPRPVRALDPLTGQDAAWDANARFEYIPGTYGRDGTVVTALLLDGPRLFMAGRFRDDQVRRDLPRQRLGGIM